MCDSLLVVKSRSAGGRGFAPHRDIGKKIFSSCHETGICVAIVHMGLFTSDIDWGR